MRLREPDVRRRIAEQSAQPMFWLSLAFLVCQAVLVVVWVDVPNLSENASQVIDSAVVSNGSHEELLIDVPARGLETFVVRLMLVIWPIVILESVFHWLTRPWDLATQRYHFFGFLFCLCPSLRMCARSPEMNSRLWLPGLGWRRPNKHLRSRLERHFSIPMIVIALMIMPILVVEFFMKNQVAEYAWLRLVLHVGTGVIWFAFAAEFILMVSVAEKKLTYCRTHWVDLAIILLPIFSFLRSLRVLRATRVAKLMRIQQLTKLARVYRLRGTAIKAFRALMVLELVHRLFADNPQRTIDKLKLELDELENQSKQLRRRIAKLERQQSLEKEPDAVPVNSTTSATANTESPAPELNAPNCTNP